MPASARCSGAFPSPISTGKHWSDWKHFAGPGDAPQKQVYLESPCRLLEALPSGLAHPKTDASPSRSPQDPNPDPARTGISPARCSPGSFPANPKGSPFPAGCCMLRTKPQSCSTPKPQGRGSPTWGCWGCGWVWGDEGGSGARPRFGVWGL